jgi:hypothetical protein
MKQATSHSARIAAALLAGGLLFFTAACSDGSSTASPAKPAAKPAVSADYQAAARSVLGDDAEIILSGDLAHNGHIQLLVVNRLPKMPKNVVPGLLVSRATILEKDGADWREIFLADEFLKNPKGFLAGTPLSSVTDWRLQYEQPKTGLAMYLTPLQRPAGGYQLTIEVRWNPATRRYQSLDRDFKHFLLEAPSLQPPPSFRLNR